MRQRPQIYFEIIMRSAYAVASDSLDSITNLAKSHVGAWHWAVWATHTSAPRYLRKLAVASVTQVGNQITDQLAELSASAKALTWPPHSKRMR